MRAPLAPYFRKRGGFFNRILTRERPEKRKQQKKDPSRPCTILSGKR